MKQELEAKLYADFPELFAEVGLPAEKTAMCWGCECCDYWEPAIRGACQRITDHYRANKDKLGDCPTISQVKEKFGGLRIYMHGSPDDEFREIIDEAVNEAEMRAGRTCQYCGSDTASIGSIDGWWAATCKPCEAKIRAKEKLDP